MKQTLAGGSSTFLHKTNSEGEGGSLCFLQNKRGKGGNHFSYKKSLEEEVCFSCKNQTLPGVCLSCEHRNLEKGPEGGLRRAGFSLNGA